MQEKNSNLFSIFFQILLTIFEKKTISVKKILNNPQKFILYEEIYSLIQKEICFFYPTKTPSTICLLPKVNKQLLLIFLKNHKPPFLYNVV